MLSGMLNMDWFDYVWSCTYYKFFKIIFNFLPFHVEIKILCHLLDLIFASPFNSHEWPRQNFSLQYQYNINQISDENNEKY